MEGFADNKTLSIENSIESLQGVTDIIENFGNLSGLRKKQRENTSNDLWP